MTDKYKEIKIPGRSVEFEADPVDQVIEVELDDFAEDQPEENFEEQEPVVTKEVEKPKADDKPAKESRAKKRIQQLHSEKQEALRLAEKERLEKEMLLKELMNLRKDTTTDTAVKLEDKIAILTKQLTEAIRQGEAEEVVRLQDELISSKMELASKKHELKNIEKLPEPKGESHTKNQNAGQVPEKALEWIAEHPLFNTDELFHTAAIVVNNQLIKEGYDVSTEEFYEELNERLAPRFPEVFGIAPKTQVKSNSKKISSEEELSGEEEQEDVKTEIVQKPAKRVQQTVSGSSRPTGSGVVQPKKLASATMTPADIAQAERWGLDVNQVARRMAHIEKSRDSNGYAPIFVDRK
jgi:hypothetical protein